MRDGLSWIDTVTGLRDAALLVGGAVYVFGYVTWAVYAAQYQLGPLPALDTQYFVAGIVPLLSTVGVLGAVWLMNRRWRPVLVRMPPKRRFLVTFPILALGALLTLFSTHIGVLIGFLLLVGVIAAGEEDWLGIRSATTRRWLETTFFAGIGIMVAVLYAMFGFAEIPPELGGGAPRCAYLEIDASAVGAGSQRGLARLDKENVPARIRSNEDTEINAKRQVFSTDPLYVWQVSDDWIVVRTHQGSRDSVQLPTTAVRSIEWLGHKDPEPCPWGLNVLTAAHPTTDAVQ
jgi:hypothetical protein